MSDLICVWKWWEWRSVREASTSGGNWTLKVRTVRNAKRTNESEKRAPHRATYDINLSSSSSSSLVFTANNLSSSSLPNRKIQSLLLQLTLQDRLFQINIHSQFIRISFFNNSAIHTSPKSTPYDSFWIELFIHVLFFLRLSVTKSRLNLWEGIEEE